MRRWVGIAVCLPLLALAVSGCDSPTGGLACTQIGCDSGLVVELSALPAAPFSVEVFAASPDETPSYRYACDGGAGPCTRRIFFSGLIVDRAFIRVTTTEGSVLHDIQRVDYRTSQPNGAQCPPTCRSATVSLPLPPGA